MSRQEEVVMYRTRFCIYCRMAERLLVSKKIEFERIDVSGKHALRKELRERTGRTTVPQIFVAGVSIGGYDELSALDRTGALDKMVWKLRED